jgi:hypothetical protein
LAKSGDDPGIIFTGSAQDFVASLRAKLVDIDKQCVIRYKNSIGGTVRISLLQLLPRLNRMIFDPYHCPEKRWGASGDELSTCRDGDPGHRWYNAQAHMRNTTGKTTASDGYVIRSNQPITLLMLENPAYIDQPDNAPINLGTATPPVTDLEGALASEKFLQMLEKQESGKR